MMQSFMQPLKTTETTLSTAGMDINPSKPVNVFGLQTGSHGKTLHACSLHFLNHRDLLVPTQTVTSTTSVSERLGTFFLMFKWFAR